MPPHKATKKTSKPQTRKVLASGPPLPITSCPTHLFPTPCACPPLSRPYLRPYTPCTPSPPSPLPCHPAPPRVPTEADRELCSLERRMKQKFPGEFYPQPTTTRSMKLEEHMGGIAASAEVLAKGVETWRLMTEGATGPGAVVRRLEWEEMKERHAREDEERAREAKRVKEEKRVREEEMRRRRAQAVGKKGKKRK